MEINLTPAEKMKLDRRRRGESQQEAAERWGVTLYRYREAEAGRRSESKIRPRFTVVRDYEACLVLRTRRGDSVAALAKEMGISRWWLTQIERGKQPADELVRYWSTA